MNNVLEVARLDENGVITSVETVTEQNYKTDPVARTVRLEPGHDMRNHLRSYRWNFHRNTFESLSTTAVDVAERDTAELVEGMVETIEDIAEHLNSVNENRKNVSHQVKEFKLSRRMDRVLKEYRRHNKRKDKDLP